MKAILRAALLAAASMFSFAGQALSVDTSEVEALKTYGFVKPARFVSRVFVHCTASDHAHHDNIEILRKWHVDQNGW